MEQLIGDLKRGFIHKTAKVKTWLSLVFTDMKWGNFANKELMRLVELIRATVKANAKSVAV